MKDKVLKVLFIISVLPYVLTLALGITTTFVGIGGWMGTSKQYGFEAFSDTIFTCIVFLLPVFLICALFQYWYIKKIADVRIKKFDNICRIISYIVLIITFLGVIIYNKY